MRVNAALKSMDGSYVCADNAGGGKVTADRGSVGPWETLGINVYADGGRLVVTFRAGNGQYLGGRVGQPVTADRSQVGPEETFDWLDRGNGTYAFRSSDGGYLQADNGGHGGLSVAPTTVDSGFEFFTVEVQPFVDKELSVGFTTAFELVWNDGNSGASRDSALWRPHPPAGFYSLGDLVVDHHDGVGGRQAIAVVQDLSGTALRPPTDYNWVWDDSGSGASMDGSVWEPIPPTGYLAMGLVSMGSHGVKPSTDAVRCVRADLVRTGLLSTHEITSDQDSGGDHDASFWGIVSQTERNEARLELAPGTFAINGSYDRPQSVPGYAKVFRPDPRYVAAQVSQLSVPQQRSADPYLEPARQSLLSMLRRSTVGQARDLFPEEPNDPSALGQWQARRQAPWLAADVNRAGTLIVPLLCDLALAATTTAGELIDSEKVAAAEAAADPALHRLAFAEYVLAWADAVGYPILARCREDGVVDDVGTALAALPSGNIGDENQVWQDLHFWIARRLVEAGLDTTRLLDFGDEARAELAGLLIWSDPPTAPQEAARRLLPQVTAADLAGPKTRSLLASAGKVMDDPSGNPWPDHGVLDLLAAGESGHPYATGNWIAHRLFSWRDPSQGKALQTGIAEWIKAKVPGTWDDTRSTFRELFFTDYDDQATRTLPARPYDLADAAATAAGRSGDWWQRFSIAVLCQGIYEVTTYTRAHINGDMITSDLDTFNKELPQVAVAWYVGYVRSQLEAIIGDPPPGGLNAYLDVLTGDAWITWKLAQASQGNWPDQAGELFDHWAKLAALGATDDQIAGAIQTLVGKGMEISPEVTAGAWRGYVGWLPDLPVTWHAIESGSLKDQMLHTEHFSIADSRSDIPEVYCQYFIRFTDAKRYHPQAFPQ